MQNHPTILLIAILILSLLTSNSFGQNSKKEKISRNRQLASLSIDEIKTRNHSELAKEFSIGNFMAYYIENGKEKISKEYGNEIIDSIYRDTTFTYYLHRTQSYAIDLIKVTTADIIDINISEIDGNSIRKKFLDEVVPNEDKERVKRKSKNCGMGSDYYDFEYLYDKRSRTVEIKYKWKVTCDFFRVINKTYKSNYGIDNKLFKN